MNFKKIVCLLLISASTLIKPHLAFRSKTMIQNGTFSTKGAIELEVETLSGNGTFQSDTILIHCEKFEFTGTIHCSEKCVIHCSTAFDESCFKREGNGVFVIDISPYSFEKSEIKKDVQNIVTAESEKIKNIQKKFEEQQIQNQEIQQKLQNHEGHEKILLTQQEKDLLQRKKDKAEQLLMHQCGIISESDVDDCLNIILLYANIYKINIKTILCSIMDELWIKMDYHQKRIYEIYDYDYLKNIALRLGATITGLTLMYTMYLWKNEVKKQFSISDHDFAEGFIVFGGISLIPLIGIKKMMETSLYPHHEQKLEKLKMIQQKIQIILQ